MLAACSRQTRVFLEPSPQNVANGLRGPVQIRYFFDRTMSMRGFTTITDSAYTRTIPLLWGAGDSLWPTADSFYYVYGTIQVGRIERAYLEDSQGLLVPEFYFDGPRRGVQVRPSHGRPFYTLHGYIHDIIDPTARGLYVVVTYFNEAHNPAVFSRFFQVAFDRGLSGALFAVRSEFDGIVWNVYNNRSFPEAGTTGRTMSTFFILVIGSRLEVEQYSERLFSDFVGAGISFNHTVFLVGPEERVAFPDIGRFIDAPNIRLFESELETNPFSTMVNLRPLDNRQLGLFRWVDSARYEAAGVEAYQIMRGIGSRYSALLTRRAFDTGSFDYNVTTEVWFHDGERRNPSHGVTSEFSEFRAAGNHFDFRVVPNPVDSVTGGFFRQLYLIGETRNHDTLESGFYRVAYRVQANAVIPAWVMEKNAETIGEFGAMHERMDQHGERVGLGVLGLRRVHNDIIVAYNRNNERLAWSGELYFVRRR